MFFFVFFFCLLALHATPDNRCWRWDSIVDGNDAAYCEIYCATLNCRFIICKVHNLLLWMFTFKGSSFSTSNETTVTSIFLQVTQWHHPNFFAYFPTGCSYSSLLADMLSAAFGCVGFSWVSSAFSTLSVELAH